MAYLYIFGTICFTVYSLMIIKWRVMGAGVLPPEFLEKILFLLRLLRDPLVWSGLLSAFIASLFWMMTMTKLNLSYAYPFMSLSYILVLIFSVLIFKEPFTVLKVVGLILIILGLVISSRSI